MYIVIQPPEFPPPPPKPKPKPKPKIDSNDFKIRLTRFISKGAPLPKPFDKGPTPAGGAAVFEMVDVATSRRAIFLLTAGGVQVPMPFDANVPPPDLGGDNSFTKFHADSGSGPHRSIEFEDFEGDADFSRGPLGLDPRLKFNGDPAKFILRVTGKDVSKGNIAIDMDLDPDILFQGLSGKMQLLSQSLKL